MKIEAGSVVALTQCPVWVGQNPPEPVPMSGLFVLEDYQPYEPSAYAWSSGWWIAPVNWSEETHGNHDWLWVEDSDLIPQVNPQAYGRMLELEREMEFAEEREAA